jgi:serine/threonine protein kinase
VLKLLKHPNIMQFMDYWVTEGEAREDGTRRVQITFITEVSTSGTLRRYLMKAKPRAQNPIKIIQRWCRQILSGVHRIASYRP